MISLDAGRSAGRLDGQRVSTVRIYKVPSVYWILIISRRYAFNVTDIVSSIHTATDKNLTVTFESAWLYGLNVSSRSDAESLGGGDVRRIYLI